MDQPQSFGDFAHGHYTAVVHQVNLPFSYHYHHRSKGTSLPRWRRGTTVHQGERLFVRSQTGRSTSCASFPYHYNYTYYNVYPKGRQAYSLLLQTTMEPLPHGLLVLSSSKPLTGRTGHRLRDASVYWNYLSHSLEYRNTLPDKDSSHDDATTCLVGLHH